MNQDDPVLDNNRRRANPVVNARNLAVRRRLNPENVIPQAQAMQDVPAAAPAVGGSQRARNYLAGQSELQRIRKLLREAAPKRARKVFFVGDDQPSWIPATGSYRKRRFGSRGYTPRYRSYSRRSYGGYGRRRYSGRGGYFADILGAGAGFLGNGLNKYLKPLSGVDTSNWGSAVTKWGEGVERGLFNRYMGSGAYDNKAAVGPNSRLEQSVPQFDQSSCREGCTEITNREFLGDITSSTAFNIAQTIALNPGISESFPWLSSVAQNYCQYRFRSLIFTFKSTSGALSTTQALGEIIGAANYNVYEKAFTNKTQMLNEVFSSSKVPSEDCLFPIECDPSQTTGTGLLYIRGASGVPSNQDQRFYDLGTFYLATTGQPAGGVVLGELWVSYVVEFYKPQLNSIGVEPSSGACAHYAGTTYSNSTPLNLPAMQFDNIGGTIGTRGYIFPADFSGDVFMCCMWVGSSGVTPVSPNITGSTAGITALSVLQNDTGAGIAASVGASGATQFIFNFVFRISNTGAYAGVAQTLLLSTGGTLPASPVSVDVVINTYPVNSFS